jgi:hypothetical protein
MSTKTESSKFSELRAKTDRQLAAFVTNRLDAGLRFARFTACQAEAERSYAEVSALIPWVDGLTMAERRLLESKLERLREVLNDLSSDAELIALTASSS